MSVYDRRSCSDVPLQFKFKLTTVMIVDFVGCWLIEVVCKWLFADMEPKAMIVRGRERREKRRITETLEKKEQ